MSDPDQPNFPGIRRDPASTGRVEIMPGNRLFETAVQAIGFDPHVVRLSLTGILNTIGAYPDALTPDDLGIVFPEIDRRLRKLAPDEHIDAAMKRLQQMLLAWEEPV